MEFPKMIYLGGEHGAAHRIVASQAAQDAAKADGFMPLGETAGAPVPAVQAAPVTEQSAAPADPHAETVTAADPPTEPAPAVNEKAELVAALEAAGIDHKKSWGVAKLRAALEAKPE